MVNLLLGKVFRRNPNEGIPANEIVSQAASEYIKHKHCKYRKNKATVLCDQLLGALIYLHFIVLMLICF